MEARLLKQREKEYCAAHDDIQEVSPLKNPSRAIAKEGTI